MVNKEFAGEGREDSLLVFGILPVVLVDWPIRNIIKIVKPYILPHHRESADKIELDLSKPPKITLSMV